MKAGNEFKHLVNERIALRRKELLNLLSKHNSILLDYAGGESIASICKKYKCSHMQIYHILKTYGLERRNEKHHTGRTVARSDQLANQMFVTIQKIKQQSPKSMPIDQLRQKVFDAMRGETSKNKTSR